MEKFDLSKPVNNIEGDPILSEAQYILSRDEKGKPQAQEVSTENGDTFEDVHAIIQKAEYLTYRKAIQRALLADVNPERNQGMPDKHKRSVLALKLTADKDVNFTSGEITTIKKSAKNDPNTSTVVYMRIAALLDPADMGIDTDEGETEMKRENK